MAETYRKQSNYIESLNLYFHKFFLSVNVSKEKAFDSLNRVISRELDMKTIELLENVFIS